MNMTRIVLLTALLVLVLRAPVSAQAQDAKAQATTAATTQGSEDPPEKNDPVVNPMRSARSIKRLKIAPLYAFNEKDVDTYLKFLADDEKDPLKRVMHLARKNI